jgi:ribosomal protein L19
MELMSIYVAEVTVDSLGRVVVDHLPFKPGDRVDVTVRTHKEDTRDPDSLEGSVLRFENPFDPVATDDWHLQP